MPRASMLPEMTGPLRALKAIQSVGDREPFGIVPIKDYHGSIMGEAEVMRNKVRWAVKAGYGVLTTNVPERLAPYNAIIRISESGTEDRNLDYLAHIIEEDGLARRTD